MKSGSVKKVVAAFVVSIGLASSAAAEIITLDIQASGALFGNQAAATGSISFDTDLLPTAGVGFVQTPLFPAVSALQLIVSRAAGGNGAFGLSDFRSIAFSSPSPLDFGRQLIGQSLSNGCLFGVSTGTCVEGNAGDFNLFAANGAAPNGSNYFQLTTSGGLALRITSLAPGMAVSEPATAGLFGLGLLGLLALRRRAARYT